MAQTGMTLPAAAPLRAKLSREEWLMRAAVVLLGLYLLLTVVLPLWSLLGRSLLDRNGVFVGLENYIRYFGEPGLRRALAHSVTVSTISTAITIAIAFAYAYALTRSAMPAKGLFRGIALIPLLAPSLLPGLALVYLFGNKGVLKGLLFGETIYGPIGIVIGEVFFSLPQALIILLAALATADQRLYEAAATLRASRLRIFLTVTLPGCRYGLISATLVVFTNVFTDFGVPKVIGGDYRVLATDIYRHVIGQFNFEMGAVVGMLLLVPAALSFVVERIVHRRQRAQITAGAVPFEPKQRLARDLPALALCSAVSVFLLTMLGIAIFGSLVNYWPYDLTLTLKHYRFGSFDPTGWGAYRNSLIMASATAVAGTIVVFVGAYVLEKAKGIGRLRALVHLLCMLSLAVPGLVLGLSYIFFFNDPANPLHALYFTMTLLVINTMSHFYTVPHLTAVTALKQLDAEFESVSASLKVPFYRTFWRITVPICLPAIIDIAVYLFVSAMTTVSAVVFIYSAEHVLASLSILRLDDSGRTAPAAAFGVVIVATSAGLRLIQAILLRGILRRSQAWRRR